MKWNLTILEPKALAYFIYFLAGCTTLRLSNVSAFSNKVFTQRKLAREGKDLQTCYKHRARDRGILLET